MGFGIAHELAGAPPYWPWSNALRDLAARGWGERLGAAAEELSDAAVLDQLLGAGTIEVTRRLGHQFQTFGAVADLFDAFGREQPMLLVLEDLHWADQASLDLLHFLGRSQRHGRVLVVATHGPTAGGDAIGAMLAGVVTEPSVERLRLAPLDGDEVRQLVERLLEQPVERALADRSPSARAAIPFSWSSWCGSCVPTTECST